MKLNRTQKKIIIGLEKRSWIPHLSSAYVYVEIHRRMDGESVELRRNRKEQERERRRLRDRERRQSMSQDERERHLARRRKNYQLRRQRAEVSRLDSQIQPITAAVGASPPDSGASSVPFLDSDHSAEELSKVMGTIRLSRIKHLARTLGKASSGAEVSFKAVTDTTPKGAILSSGLRLSRVKQMMRAKGLQESHPQTQGPKLPQSLQPEDRSRASLVTVYKE